MVPPMSTTTASPGWSTRLDGSWCGLAAFGPDAMITKSARTWPSLLIAAATSAATLRLGPARPQPARHGGVHPVDGRPGLPQRGDLGGALARPQAAQGGAGQAELGRGQRGAEPEHHHRPHAVRQAHRGDRAEPGGDQRVRVVRLVPGRHLQAEAPGGRGLRGGQLQPRHHQERVPGRGQDQAGEPLQLLRVVAGHVAQVRARGEQQRTQSGRSRRRPRPAAAALLDIVQSRRRRGARYPRNPPGPSGESACQVCMGAI